MKEFDVYVNGKYVGTVLAKDESDARLAAFHKFDTSAINEVSVNPR